MSADAQQRLEGWGDRDGGPIRQAKRTGPDSALLLLRDDLGPCRMWCSFCPHALTVERAAPVDDDGLLDEIVASFAGHLRTLGVRSVAVVSMDILDFPRLFELLDAARAAHVRVLLGTPGLRLADPELVARLSAYDVELDVTVHATDPELTRHIVRTPEAHDAIERGLTLCRQAGLRVHVATVLSADNVRDLPDLVRHLTRDHGVDTITVRAFFPDVADPPAAYLDQFPAWSDVQRALDALDALALDPAPTLVLGNVPHCQLDLTSLSHLRIVQPHHAPWQNAYAFPGHPDCLTCSAADRCVGIHPAYAERHPVRPIDPARIAANLDLRHDPHRIDEGVDDGHADDGPTGPPPNQVVPRDQGVPVGEGLLPGETASPAPPSDDTTEAGPPPGAILPGQGIPKGQGLPPEAGTPRSEGRPPDAGPPDVPPNLRVPRGLGVPKSRGRPPMPRPPRPPLPSEGRFPMLVLRPRGGPVAQLAFSPDGRHLLAVTGGARAALHTWDLHTRGPQGRLGALASRLGLGRAPGQPMQAWHRRLEGAPGPIAGHPDLSAWFVPTGRSAEVRPCRAADGVPVGPVLDLGDAALLAVHPDTGHLLAGGPGLSVVDPDAGTRHRLLDPDVTLRSLAPVRGRRVLVVPEHAPPMMLSLDGGPAGDLPDTGVVRAAAWSADGTWFVTVDTRHLTVWDVARGRPRWRRAAARDTRWIGITPDERHLVEVGGSARAATSRTLRLWNIDGGMKRADLIGHTAPVHAAAMHRGGRLVATGDSAGGILLWDLTPEVSRPA